MAAALLCGSMTAFAQESAEQFTIATLNVDGLPQKILVVKLNSDGPGDAGTARISKYLMQKNYDLVMMQEDFSYHNVLTVLLEDDYQFDEWSGEISLSRDIDFLHLQNHRFACDGLMACWKNDLTVVPQGRTAWTESFGKFSHANDDLITKGFRRYDVTLRDGETHILVYNMHMDASLDEDEAEGLDAKDKEARMSQWKQLKEDIMEHLSSPIILVGDMNSLYGRDNVKSEFIDAFSGIADVTDVWVEMKQNGIYPDDRNKGVEAGEMLDKIIYINPQVTDNGYASIQPVDFQVDREGYQYNGKPLGDHYPVVATFQVSYVKTGIDTMQGGDEEKETSVYNLNGQRISESQRGIVIKRQGDKIVKHINK